MIKCDGGTTGAIQNITTNTGGLPGAGGEAGRFRLDLQGLGGDPGQARQGRAQRVPGQGLLRARLLQPGDHHQRVLPERPGRRGRRFLAATAQGYEYAIAHPDEAADLLIAANPPGTFPDPPWSTRARATWPGNIRPRRRTGARKRCSHGPATRASWSTPGRLEDANHQPVTADLDYAGLFTNDLLPAK